MIEVKRKSANKYSVVVKDEASRTRHSVIVGKAYYQKLTNEEISVEELIKRSFEFLLTRESKESILPNFNLKVINRYFPNYESKIRIKKSEGNG